MSKARWMTGALAGLMLLAPGSAAWAQLRNGYESQAGADDAYPSDQRDSAAPGQYDDDPRRDNGQPPRADDDFSDLATGEATRNTPRPHDPETDAVIDDCALGARDEAERNGGYAEVRQVGDPRETRQGYSVEGDVEVRTSWSAQDGQVRHFTCSVENGRVAYVRFQDSRTVR